MSPRVSVSPQGSPHTPGGPHVLLGVSMSPQGSPGPGSLLAGVVLGAGQCGVLGDVGDDLCELAARRHTGALISPLN